jgi:uncharacterized SAM-binding protein YcdF (DUF218 family)
LAGVTYLEPALPLLLLLGIVDVVRAWARSDARHRPWLETFVVGGLLFLSMNAGAWLLSRPLESGYSYDPMPHDSADAMVVLAGAVSRPSSIRPYALPAADTYRRVRRAAWLFRYWKPLPILVSGNGLDAEVMRHVLESEGVPRAMIWLEWRGRNTHESAIYCSEVLRARGVTRIVMVVEASGMPRAVRSFEKFGLQVVPCPVRHTQLTWEWSDVWPEWRAIESNGETMHELGGLVWYKLRGWI